jgi:hypothetical protein
MRTTDMPVEVLCLQEEREGIGQERVQDNRDIYVAFEPRSVGASSLCCLGLNVLTARSVMSIIP